MSQQNIYLLSLLPSLDALGAPPSLSCAEFLGKLEDDADLLEMAEAVLLSDDLLQRDSYLAGEAEPPSPVVLTVAQVQDEMPLPEVLAAEEQLATDKIPSDAVWASYFRYVAAVGEKRRSRFLERWAGYEVALRNAIAEARARTLELDPTAYLVAEEVASTSENFASTVSEWSAAPNPLEGQRVLDAARWRWLMENDAYFSFGDDELVAYAAKLMLTVRWHRLHEAIEEQNQSKQ
ncbi:MAG: DUF2764 domain-containing protein [Phycisphaerae bacterium]|nr:DUF2764 domain-containing protein [Phycisphaerae bacterium]